MPISRRSLLIGSGAVAAGGGLAVPYILGRKYTTASPLLGTRQALNVPAVLDARQTSQLSLVATQASTEFVPGKQSATMGFNQPYLGPVLRVKSGSEVAATVQNRTDRTISVHWHGLRVLGAHDGGPHQPIAAGQSWAPTLNIAQPQATAWYHTHIHRHTASDVYAGLAGALLIDDGLDAELGLPSTYGTDDLVLVIQDKRFDAAGRLVYAPSPLDLAHGFQGRTIVVNGVIDPYVEVPTSIVRLRLLNAANARTFELVFEDSRPFHVIASDGGLLPAPLQVGSLRIAPGERFEILADFSDGAITTLVSRSDFNGHFCTSMMDQFKSAVADTFGGSFPVIEFRPDSELKASVKNIPSRLVDAAAPRDMANASRREFILDEGLGTGTTMPENMGTPDSMTINGKPFDMTRLDFAVALGTTEIWTVKAGIMAHPFHVHGVHFQVMAEAGGQPKVENTGWKDTVHVEDSVELLVRFDTAAPADQPFMFHCHNLEHEDAGMMGQYAVI